MILMRAAGLKGEAPSSLLLKIPVREGNEVCLDHLRANTRVVILIIC